MLPPLSLEETHPRWKRWVEVYPVELGLEMGCKEEQP